MIDKKELLFVVDENNNPLEPKPRDEVHTKGYWHRNSHVRIINSKKEILCQKRSMRKDSNPGYWEAFFGGHLAPDEDYLDGAVNEVNEELNLNISKDDLLPFKINKSEIDKEFQSIYRLTWGGEITKINFDKEETDQLKWTSLTDLKEILLKKKDPEWTMIGYEKEVLAWLEN